MIKKSNLIGFCLLIVGLFLMMSNVETSETLVQYIAGGVLSTVVMYAGVQLVNR